MQSTFTKMDFNASSFWPLGALSWLAFFTGLSASVGFGAYQPSWERWPFSGAAGTAGSAAVAAGDGAIEGWATQVKSVQFGAAVDTVWRDVSRALGPAGNDVLDVVSLGRGGEITLSFAGGFRNGPGWDFAVFENAFSDFFLELAWVEVSSDGVHFVRFPNYSYTGAPVGGFGQVDPRNVDGFAGKYRAGFGTPFDLTTLQGAYDAAVAGRDDFTASYRSALLANFPRLDLGAVRFVRLVDVVGDGRALDAEGAVIYDPYPTTGSAGFDLDGVAVRYLVPEQLSWEAYAAREGISVGSFGDDADGDGAANGWEYFGGTGARNRQQRPTREVTAALLPMPGGVGDAAAVAVELRWRLEYAGQVDAILTGETAPNPGGPWTLAPITVELDPASRRAQIRMVLPVGHLFGRLRLSLPTGPEK